MDFGFLHCVDEEDDFKQLIDNGILDYIKELKQKGIVKHIGFSSHTPTVANLVLDTGLIDMMMFSINPAYDYEVGDELGIGSLNERKALFARCQKEGVGISVMKPFFAGKLLQASTSPFNQALTHAQCLQYALDRPGVLVCVPGVQSMQDLDTLLTFEHATPEQKDYANIALFTKQDLIGTCVYCNHCQPCPAHIDIALVNKYYDLAQVGDELAKSHYDKLVKKASDCFHCNHCNQRCPFKVKQCERMSQIKEYFKK